MRSRAPLCRTVAEPGRDKCTIAAPLGVTPNYSGAGPMKAGAGGQVSMSEGMLVKLSLTSGV